MNVIEQITAQYIHLSPKEQILATYILQKGHLLKNTSIQELAKITGVSPATITRFCRKIGYTNFVEMKLDLQAKQPAVEPTESLSSFDRVTHFYQRVIQRTKESISVTELRQLIELLERAKRIIIYGMGSSGLTAKELAIRLSRMGLNATSETDAHMMIIGSTVVQPDDLVIGISNSGESRDVLTAMANAKRYGATLVGITSIVGSSLTRLTPHTFIVHNSRFVNNEQFVNTQLSIVYFVDILTLLLLENPTYSQNMKLTIKEITALNQL